MDDKLKVIGELIEEIKEIRKSSPSLSHERLFQADILTDDIVQKLAYLRNLCSGVPLNAQEQRYYDALLIKESVRQRLSLRGSLRGAQMINLNTEAVLNNDGSDLTEIAYNAFENENYAKCVRTIERIAALQESKLNSTLMDLCHKSYKKVIQSAASNNDRLKLCEWWRLFVESTTLDDSSNEALLCQIDCRSECLQERLKLARSVSERMNISEMLIVGLIEGYEVAAQCCAPFSVTKLKERIDGLCSMISDHLRNCFELNKMSLVVEEGIELLRLIYSEAKDEFSALTQSNIKDDRSEETLLEVMNEIRLVLQHCSWCDVSSHSESEVSPCSTASNSSTTTTNKNESNTLVQKLSGDMCSDNIIIDSRF